jgi:hypothetical protein
MHRVAVPVIISLSKTVLGLPPLLYIGIPFILPTLILSSGAILLTSLPLALSNAWLRR